MGVWLSYFNFIQESEFIIILFCLLELTFLRYSGTLENKGLVASNWTTGQLFVLNQNGKI
jgi:hypothetical protein